MFLAAIGCSFSTSLYTMPFFIVITRSAVLAICGLCVVKRMVMPKVVCRLCESSTIILLFSSSREPVASSQKRSRGLLITARAIEVLCCCPPESSAGNLCSKSSNWTPGGQRTGKAFGGLYQFLYCLAPSGYPIADSPERHFQHPCASIRQAVFQYSP